MIDIAEQIERMADSFAYFLESSDPSWLNWRPETSGHFQGRAMLELAGECISTNQYVAALLKHRGVEPLNRDQFVSFPVDAADARRQLVESGKALADAVRQLSLEDSEATFSHWRGPVLGRHLVMGTYRNMAYHAGQINMIQILRGDSVFHIPPTWY